MPTAGAKAWLWSELARELGATPGPGSKGLGDGIVANVEVSYPGTIVSLLQPPWHPGRPDPWSFDRLTFTVLDVITGPEAAQLEIPFDVTSEPLLVARRIAGLFDSYHVRRPAMIDRWSTGSAVLSPVATSRRSVEDDWAADKLDEADGWQFRTWRAVLARIGHGGPRQRLNADNLARCESLLVAGLQSLSLQQIACLEMIADRCDVQALLVHPSRPLATRWAATLPPLSRGVPPPREPAELPDDLDPLVAVCLHGARETQALLASQGHRPVHLPAIAAAAATGPGGARPSLLARMQRSIASAAKPVAEDHDPAHDPSFTVHRCHTLSRQAEVLHDALVHAFHDLDGLRPHDVVIVSPVLEKLAPHLTAVFDREIVGNGGGVKLPLIVADRGLHEVSEAATLLIDLTALVGSRCSIEQFRAVATHPLVRKHFGVTDDMIRTWDHLVDRTAIRWGFDAEQRRRAAFPPEAAEAHTWRAGLERMLLGATLPDDTPRAELGRTVPLADVPLASLAAIETLTRIFDVVAALDGGRSERRDVAAWCRAIEAALFGLCGTEPRELAEPLRAVRTLADAATTTPVPFGDVRTLLVEALESVVGRQPLRTGAITATSMVPLRDVPFRVVCVAGYDDAAVAMGEPQGDDLVSRQALAGDIDPRIDTRRALLDCVLAARERLVVTCNGVNIRNNQTLPLVTPLAEIVDFAVRHGVARPDPATSSAIEVAHPRHAVSPRNFAVGEVQPGITWSHDAAALAASRRLGNDEPRQTTRPSAPRDLPVVELAMLEDMVRDPLKLYLKKTLGIDTWRDDDEFPAATIPLTVAPWEGVQLADELFRVLVQGGSEADWIAAVRASGRVPVSRFGEGLIAEIVSLVRAVRSFATDPKKPVPLTGLGVEPVRVQLPGRLLSGNLPGFHRGENLLVEVRFTKGTKDARGLPLHVAALRLLVAHAAGHAPTGAVVIARHEKWSGPNVAGKPAIARTVTLGESLRDPSAAAARLAELADLLPRALAAPCGRFGGKAAEIVESVLAGRSDEARKTFRDHVTSRHAGSAEEIVYGSTPRFDDVFREDSHEFTFHRDFERLLSFPPRSYELS